MKKNLLPVISLLCRTFFLTSFSFFIRFFPLCLSSLLCRYCCGSRQYATIFMIYLSRNLLFLTQIGRYLNRESFITYLYTQNRVYDYDKTSDYDTLFILFELNSKKLEFFENIFFCTPFYSISYGERNRTFFQSCSGG